MNRTIILLVLLSALSAKPIMAQKITVDPNAPGTTPPLATKDNIDLRLQQKVTYKVEKVEVSVVIEDLKKLTGIKFYSGKSTSDWRVREDIINIYATDIPLATLMSSIAHVMKLKWIKGGKEPEWTYRLAEDSRLINSIHSKEKTRKDREREKRRQYFNKMANAGSMTKEELAKLHEEDPASYLNLKIGAMEHIIKFMNTSPGLRDAWIDGQDYSVHMSGISPEAREAYIKAIECMMPAESYAEANSVREYIEIMRKEFGNQKIEVNDSGIYIGGYAGVYFSPPSERKSRLFFHKAALKAFEEKITIIDAINPVRDEMRKARDQERKLSFGNEEPWLEHAEDPALQVGIKDKLELKNRKPFTEPLEAVSGYAVVIDDYDNYYDQSFTKGTKLQKVLDELSLKEYMSLNWNVNNGVIEIWNRNWYDRRESRVSLTWKKRLQKKLEDTGTLDIDDLAEIATLTDEQIHKMCNGPVLRVASNKIFQNLQYLRFYGSLNRSQRALLLSDSGLAFADLTSEQQQAALNISTGLNTSILGNASLPDVGLKIAASRIHDGKRYIYTFHAFTNLGPIPGERKFSTPVYIKPEKEAEDKSRNKK